MGCIPIANAYEYCPRCAAPNSSPGAIPFKCSRCHFACFFGPVAAVGGLVVKGEDQLLLVRRARDPGQGKWGLPGGFIDRDETAEQALAREVLEETGLIVTRSQYLLTLPNQYNYLGVTAPVIDLFFLCEVESIDNVSIAKDELEHFEWSRPTATHLENMAFDSNRQAIEHWLASLGG